MFTGIVEELGTVKKIKKGANSAVFTIRAEKILDDLKTGDSVAVNGICLTVTACLEDGFTADVMHETLNRSALIQLSLGQHVNLERAMPANGRFGGHIVAGHVDGTGKITEIRRDDNAVWYTIQASRRITPFMPNAINPFGKKLKPSVWSAIEYSEKTTPTGFAPTSEL